MRNFRRRRLLDRISGPPSLIAADTQIVGDVITQSALLVNGRVRGDGDIGGELSIADGAHWQGSLRAIAAAVHGRIDGDLTVREQLELGPKAVIVGRVSARRIAMARGAVVDGEMAVTGNEPIQQFEDRRTAILRED